jgi:hypothetical protein
MIHYHGLPITPVSAALRAITGGHAFVSFRHPGQLGAALEVVQSFAIDNGAFSAWRSGEPVTDWTRYYAWIQELKHYPPFDFAVIPDVIDGDEAANDALLNEWPWRNAAPWVGAPVWHLHESIARLERLALQWPRVCLGSSGEFAQVGSPRWYVRMSEAFEVLTDRDGRPCCKVHGLRMLDPDVFTRFPFASADSTNIGKNIGIDSRWKGNYPPASKDARAQVLRERIEVNQSPIFWDHGAAPIQTGFQWGET